MEKVSLTDWLTTLAAKQPTPGGGAAAGLAVATAAALVGMVSIYTTGPKWADRAERMQFISDEAAKLRARALELMEEDARAFAAVGAAYRLPQDTGNETDAREFGIQTALTGAAEPPRRIAELAAEVLALTEELVEASNPNVISDAAVAASFVRAGLEAATVNIEINETLLSDQRVKARLHAAVEVAVQQIQKADAVVTAVRQKMQTD